MFARISSIIPFLLAVIIAAFAPEPGAAEPNAEPGWPGTGHRKNVNGTDDWLPGPPSGEVYCSDGIVDLSNPLIPVCPPGTTIEFRNVIAFSQMHADDPRLAGLLSYVFNGSFDALSFTGRAWGTWMLAIDACPGAWEGTWAGERTWVPGQPNPLDLFLPPPGFGGVWVSRLELRGDAFGACVEGLGMKGIEIITTLTPLPLPYEMLMPCEVVGCSPEGVSTAKILGASRD